MITSKRFRILRMFDNKEDYVTEEEFKNGKRKNGDKIVSIDEITNLDKQYEFENALREWSEEYENKAYESHIYRQINAEQQALRMSNSSKKVSSAIFADKAEALLKVTNKDGNFDPSKISLLEEVKKDNSDANNRLKELSSAYDVNTGDTYFEISKTETDNIKYAFKNKEGKVENREYNIPKIIFLGSYSRYNNSSILDLLSSPIYVNNNFAPFS